MSNNSYYSSGRRPESERFPYSESHSQTMPPQMGYDGIFTQARRTPSSSFHPTYYAGSDQQVPNWDNRRSHSHHDYNTEGYHNSPSRTLPPVYGMLPQGDASPPMASTLNFYHSSVHNIEEIPVTDSDYRRYIVEPTPYEQESSNWRPGHVRCRYPDCHSPMVDLKGARAHLSCHLNNKKAYKCSCGTKFGRQSEANRHLEDQKPCERCGDPRRKQRGTKTCSRCFGTVR
ncbi:hypothetical protein M422DRAFT_28821 [Sphaerobolus stellatus SS14]|nr:hypothetical protein M422DRAFT_28821 [Sphaerobolus stellatus SS14]